MIRTYQDARDSRICLSMRRVRYTEVTGVPEAELRADLDPLSFGCFEKLSAIVKLFLCRNGLQGVSIYGALLPKVHAAPI